MISAAWGFSSAHAGTTPSINQTPDVACADSQKDTDNASCGDKELLSLQKQTGDAYTRLKSRPGATEIMRGLAKARAECVNGRVEEPDIACLRQSEVEALGEYRKLEDGKLPTGQPVAQDLAIVPRSTTGNAPARVTIDKSKVPSYRPLTGHGMAGSSI